MQYRFKIKPWFILLIFISLVLTAYLLNFSYSLNSKAKSRIQQQPTSALVPCNRTGLYCYIQPPTGWDYSCKLGDNSVWCCPEGTIAENNVCVSNRCDKTDKECYRPVPNGFDEICKGTDEAIHWCCPWGMKLGEANTCIAKRCDTTGKQCYQSKNTGYDEVCRGIDDVIHWCCPTGKKALDGQCVGFCGADGKNCYRPEPTGWDSKCFGNGDVVHWCCPKNTKLLDNQCAGSCDATGKSCYNSAPTGWDESCYGGGDVRHWCCPKGMKNVDNQCVGFCGADGKSCYPYEVGGWDSRCYGGGDVPHWCCPLGGQILDGRCYGPSGELRGKVTIDNPFNYSIKNVEVSICSGDKPYQCSPISSFSENSLKKTLNSTYSFLIKRFYLRSGISNQRAIIERDRRYWLSAHVTLQDYNTHYQTIASRYILASNIGVNLNVSIQEQPEVVPLKSKLKRKVHLLIYNFSLTTKGNKPVFDLFPPQDDPLNRAKNVAAFVSKYSNAQYEIVSSATISEKPPMKNSDKVTEFEDLFYKCNRGEKTKEECSQFKQNFLVNYNQLFDKYEICQKVNRGEINEVWVATIPWIGMGENDMIGPNPFSINGLTEIKKECKFNVPTLSIDLRTGEGNAVHSYGHRIEATMTHVYGRWKYPELNNWEKFGLSIKDDLNRSIVGCGSIHYAPNSQNKEYIYNINDFTVNSYCDDFFTYPNFQGKSNPVNGLTWKETDLGYYDWWFKHIPRKLGRSPDGKLNNWWVYVTSPETAIKEANK
ncbi:hypothetical protein A3C23_01160 [Candidatus Roizmanbacteria bacterium RIFCSPHIGHO2_02_FULL_37_13b]|uniref:Uncharacterized protein n=1 Tax=Candidatus Roizmanbacteria bacterium RIFCSPLOWO2_02_FULL_36_11 TaxID=1802071 RepID=A0A1F7JIU3_9BACT|nr:MAG: hypothetical protein A3C23_01160 [Candidatus Roizmanbacteria bacterium RIFCSPHIGHO2_02_FULL_37_13b]OGK55501.1 MAG: hypothetical protein A3H78_05025 [Candidatus Roizmanbacteria bacterium RIFCSPLOWO2_02_FULL_36_11]